MSFLHWLFSTATAEFFLRDTSRVFTCIFAFSFIGFTKIVFANLNDALVSIFRDYNKSFLGLKINRSSGWAEVVVEAVRPSVLSLSTPRGISLWRSSR